MYKPKLFLNFKNEVLVTLFLIRIAVASDESKLNTSGMIHSSTYILIAYVLSKVYLILLFA